MKRYTILLLSVVIFAASCVKDRVQPVSTSTGGNPTGPVQTTGDSLMYFWSFNNQDSSNHNPDMSVLSGASFSYAASYIDYTTGSSLNLPDSATAAGDCLRLRNPSSSVTFYMPTTGYKNVVFQFAEEASSLTSGSTLNSISYTTDGQNYIATALGNNYSYNVDTVFNKFSFDLSSDPAINNNPNFAVKISFNNNNTGTSGNDRIDNVSLVGIKE